MAAEALVFFMLFDKACLYYLAGADQPLDGRNLLGPIPDDITVPAQQIPIEGFCLMADTAKRLLQRVQKRIRLG